MSLNTSLTKIFMVVVLDILETVMCRLGIRNAWQSSHIPESGERILVKPVHGFRDCAFCPLQVFSVLLLVHTCDRASRDRMVAMGPVQIRINRRQCRALECDIHP